MQVTVTMNVDEENEEQFEDEIKGSFEEYINAFKDDYPNWTSCVIVLCRPTE